MVEREIWMQAIAYNCLRACMLEASGQGNPRRRSFKGALATVCELAPRFASGASKAARKELLSLIAQDILPWRPFRVRAPSPTDGWG